MSWKIKGAFLLFISNTLLGTDAGCYSSFTKKKNGVTFFDGENEIKDLSTKAEPGTTLTVKCANNFEVRVKFQVRPLSLGNFQLDRLTLNFRSFF